MKKTLLIMVMALAVLLTQCRKPEVKFPSPVAPEGTTVSMTVTAGPGSKTDITPAGGITWSTGDKLYVGDGTKYVGYLTIVSGVGTPTGTFSGDVTLPNSTTGDQTFHFFYLGNAARTLAVGATSAVVDFSSQNIYKNGDKLENASAQHVGYGSASGTVKDGVVTGINVTLVSKVALARFSFTEAAGKGEYSGPLALSGTGICNKMTVSFASSEGFSFSGTEGTIRLRGSHSERYVMLVPTNSTAEEILNFVGGAKGTAALENGIEANKFYGRDVAIGVEVTPQETVNMGLPSPYDKLEWATCSLGATNGATAESWYGDYYAWGATETWYSAGGQSGSPTWKDGYSDGYTWAHCPHTSGTYSDDNKKVFTKYVPQDNADIYGYGGFYDDKTVLDAGDDAATANWGSDWRMPTKEEWQSLYKNTTGAWIADYNGTGVAGWVFTSNDGKGTTLFLTAAGGYEGASLVGAGAYGAYWCSSLDDLSPNCGYARFFFAEYFTPGYQDAARCEGGAVRPVR